LFYNTGIATYIWVLSNRKPAHRTGQVQLIDASQWFKPLRKNLGKKNCELSPEDIARITQTFFDFKETPESKLFPNEAFGYWKVVVERPLRLHSQLSVPRIDGLRFASGDEDIRRSLFEEFEDALFTRFASIEKVLFSRIEEWGSDDAEDDADNLDEDGGDSDSTKPAKKGLPEKKKRKLLDPKTWERDGKLYVIATQLRDALGGQLYEDHNIFRAQVTDWLKSSATKLSAPDLKIILKAMSWREESAPPVIAKIHKPGKTAKTSVQADPLHGLYAAQVDGKPVVQEYECDPDLRDTEQVPLLEAGGIAAFIQREVLPYTSDSWVKADATKIGYEVSFTRHFYKPQPLRTLDEIRADILAIEKEASGLLDGLLSNKTFTTS